MIDVVIGIFNNGLVNIGIITLLVSQIVTKKLKPIKEDVNLAKEWMERHDGLLTQMFDNKGFNRGLEKMIESHVLFLGNKHLDAKNYIIFIGALIKSYACDVLTIGIEEISNEAAKSKAMNAVIAAKQKCATYFGVNWTDKYFRKHSGITEKYLEEICHISEDLVNDKQMRFRTITTAYAQKVMSVFVREYLQEYKAEDEKN